MVERGDWELEFICKLLFERRQYQHNPLPLQCYARAQNRRDQLPRNSACESCLKKRQISTSSQTLKAKTCLDTSAQHIDKRFPL